MKLKKRIAKWWEGANKYVWRLLVVIVVALGIALIAPPLVSLIRTSVEIRDLKMQKDALQRQISRDREIIERLADDEFLEQYARETYYMQRPNEQVFIVED